MEARSAQGAKNNNKLLASLPATAVETLQREYKPRNLQQGQVLFEPGALLDTVYFPQTGMISLLILTKEGGAIEASTIGQEGAVGLHGVFGKRTSLTRATVQVPGLFSVIPASRLARFTEESPAVREMIVNYTEVLWAESQQATACNAAHDASSRLCRWLLQSADRIGSDTVPLTQEFIAQMLGVRRTTVTLLAQSMQSKSMISYSRGQIRLLDRPAIEACACECYGVMRRTSLMSTIGVKF